MIHDFIHKDNDKKALINGGKKTKTSTGARLIAPIGETTVAIGWQYRTAEI